MIRVIAAIDDTRGLANEDTIPWHVQTDVRYFRAKTMGGTVVMGTGTYKEFAWPLPGRRNVVVSHKALSLRSGFELVQDIEAFLKAVQPEEDIWLIGGAELFKSTLQFAEELYLTKIEGDYGCTKFFPEYEKDFSLVSASDSVTENHATFRFYVYKRK